MKIKKVMSRKIKKESDISGVFGESVSFRKVAGKVVAINRPQRTMTDPTEAQVDVQDKFIGAAQYAKAQMLQDDIKAKYAEGISPKHRSAYAVAVRDYLVPPKVKSIDTDDYHGAIGGRLLIEAIDDFMVTKLKVVITDAAGALIEQGEATQDTDKPTFWRYTATAANAAPLGSKIKATAFDRPGNKASLEKVL